MTDANLAIPTTGRLLLRKLSDGAVLVGVLFFPREFQIIEGAAYPAVVSNGTLTVMTTPQDGGLPEQAVAAGVTGMLDACIWPRTTHPEVVAVRFLKAFPEDNGWTLVAAIEPHAVPKLATDPAGHGWYEVREGALEAISAPICAKGMGMGQVLSQFALWPDVAGVPHSVPAIESTVREDMLRNSRLLAEVGRGERTRESYTQVARAELSHVATPFFDPDYARHLAELEALDGLHLAAPMTLEVLLQRHAKTREAIRRVLQPDEQW